MKDADVELEKLLMMRFGSFTRKISSTWINPAKRRIYVEDLTRVFYRDESPEGLYPACIVTQNLLGEIVVITPIAQFQTLLEGWKKTNPKYVQAARRIAEESCKEHADKVNQK